MKYTVVWLPAAERELARLFNDAVDRHALTSAANELDRVLKRLPEYVGESRYDDLRISFEKPLAMLFRVFEADQRVEVIHV